MTNLEKLRELVFESDNKACFIERERILRRIENEQALYKENDRYAIRLETLLDEVSTPVYDFDYFAGRAVEALPDEGMGKPTMALLSSGHCSLDFSRLINLGLDGIVKEIEQTARKKGDEKSLEFAKNARIVVDAVGRFAVRYSKEAEKCGKLEMAKALSIVPFKPAYDFYSALQSVWLIHFIASCYVGARDYAFGRFDEYMLPFYEKALNNGQSEEELCELLAGFLMKTNEICGRTAHTFNQKPIRSHSSKQYVNIGGENPNKLSFAVLKAAEMCNMAQPQIVVLLKPDADEEFTKRTFEALSFLGDKMNIYNYDLVLNALLKKGIPKDVAKEFGYSACCTFDLPYHSFRIEDFVPVPQLFLEVFHAGEYASFDELLQAFRARLMDVMQKKIDLMKPGEGRWLGEERGRREFTLDSILFYDTAKECRYACDGTAPYNVINLFCPGIATVGDSLMVVDKLVFKEKRYTYNQFKKIVEAEFENNDALRKEILGYVRFGNDTAADDYAAMVGDAFMDAVDAVDTPDNFYLAGGFYSLERDCVWKDEVAATPDGRKRGQPFSENQSPTYGADKNGITALLKSIAKLPLDRTITGGLNVKFAQRVTPDILKALILTFFKMGGLHIGITVIDKEVLEDAMAHPEKYQSLTVRLYGFSEYFVNLPKWQQIAIVNRTEYK